MARFFKKSFNSIFKLKTREHKPPTSKPKGWLSEEDEQFTPERSFWQNPEEPISHYYRWIWEYLAYLPLLCDVKRDSRILEIGCHHGRTSRGLLQYIRSPGLYRGFDVEASQVAEATRRITHQAPNFQYLHADVYNRHYNPSGTIKASQFVFPFEAQSFDCVYAASVFTHLLPDEILNYFRETHRVLTLAGKVLFSFFILDFYKGPGTSVSPDYEFDHPYENDPGIAVKYSEHPDSVIAYSRERIEEYAKAAELRIVRVIPGLWSNSPGTAVNEQDLIVFERG
ncbi:MAG: class I SAM-dependent methyltransferase [Candidatus Aminicenantes bacterium]|nr:MAG: class I SAM-dependent methyltransferase [Candidatus Aminicenantes bacterium]